MILKYIAKDEFSAWNIFVDNSPQGSVFSKVWYLDALQVEYKILTVKDLNDKILAGIVLAKNHINTFANPFLDKYLGVLFSEGKGNIQKTKSTQFKILDLLTNELSKYKSFDYYFHPEFNNWTPFYWKSFSQETRYTYRLDLSKSVKEIQKTFHAKLKNDLKNALNNDVVVYHGVEFDLFLYIINKTFLRQGSKSPYDLIKLKSFIEKLMQQDLFYSFAAVNENKDTIAVCGLVYDNKSSYLVLNGIDSDKNIRGANSLMIMDSIKFFKEEGIPFYDFEGSMLPGVEQFYRRFGGDLVSYYRIWNDNFFNYVKARAKKLYKKFKYGR